MTESSDNPANVPQIENVEIIELLGKGGMSLVYKARQMQLDRIVAVKILSKLAVQDENGFRRFRAEAKLTNMLEHPNIVKIISFGVSKAEQPYLVMEFLNGRSLAEELKSNGPMKLSRFRDIFLPILSALAAAHHAGVIHRDIKPGNIMLCSGDGGKDQAKLVDFGIAKKQLSMEQAETQLSTKTGALLGSPTYMSPEQCYGQVLDERTDIYSICCVMYEALFGEQPFSGQSAIEVMRKHCLEPVPTASALSRRFVVPAKLASVIISGLAKTPVERPQSALELAKELDSAFHEISWEDAAVVAKARDENRSLLQSLSPKWKAVMLVLSLLLLCGGTTIVFRLNSTEHQIKDGLETMNEQRLLALVSREKNPKIAAELANTITRDPQFKKWPCAKRSDLLKAYFDYFSPDKFPDSTIGKKEDLTIANALFQNLVDEWYEYAEVNAKPPQLWKTRLSDDCSYLLQNETAAINFLKIHKIFDTDKGENNRHIFDYLDKESWILAQMLHAEANWRDSLKGHWTAMNLLLSVAQRCWTEKQFGFYHKSMHRIYEFSAISKPPDLQTFIHLLRARECFANAKTADGERELTLANKCRLEDGEDDFNSRAIGEPVRREIEMLRQSLPK